MSELIGMTMADVETLYCQTKIPLSQIEMDAVQRIALAAQRAMLKEIDILAELADCEDAWQSIRVKLGVE